MRGRLLHEEVLVNLDVADLDPYVRAGPVQFFGGARCRPYLPPVLLPPLSRRVHQDVRVLRKRV